MTEIQEAHTAERRRWETISRRLEMEWNTVGGTSALAASVNLKLEENEIENQINTSIDNSQ
jgi:hypothetical protein